jgi:hypothetical protein
MRFLIRILLALIGLPLLIIPTLWATYKNLNELPWGFNKVWGNEEDGWNGNGTQRHFWLLNGNVSIANGVQGWWPDYLRQQGIIWRSLSFTRRWWYSYKWCAIRNPAWNTRNIAYISTSVDAQDVMFYQNSGNCRAVNKKSKVDLFYNFKFANEDGEFQGKYRHTRLFNNYFLHRRWGWKVYPELFDLVITPRFKRRSVYIFQLELVNIKKES